MDADLVEVYNHLLAQLSDLLPCDGGAILIVDGHSIAIIAQHGPHVLPYRLDPTTAEQDWLERLAREQEGWLEPLAHDARPPLPVPADGATWIGAPIVVSGQPYAWLSLIGRFDSGDKHLALALVRSAALAVQHAERCLLAERQAAEAHQLVALELRMRDAVHTVAAVELVLEAAMAYAGATHGCVFVSRHGRAVVLARRGYSQEEASLLQQIPPSLERGLTGRAYTTGQIMRSDDVATDPEALPALASSRAQLIIPLRAAEQIFGLIDLQSPEPNAFRTADTEWLLDLGARAAAVIEQQRGQASEAQAGGAGPQHDLMLSSRLAVVTDLAAGVAHEINNPLTTILGYTHLLLRDQSLPQATRDDIAQIAVEGQRIAVLVERFLRFAQPTSSGKRPLAIDEPLREALGLLRSRFQENGVQVEVDIPNEPPMVVGQAGQLEQAFLDLLHNAVEAMSASDPRRIKIKVSEQAGQARVAISDSGRGIRSDLLSRVFEPGFTTKVDKGISRGLGLGLYATHSIIQDHWGRIEVQSQLRQGSTFTVCLPAI
jgi:signal transduction histidine kinase